jgi:hypothetical protein
VADINTRECAGFLERLRRRFGDHLRPSSLPAILDPCENRSLAISPEVRASLHDDGLTILHIPTGRVFVCNRTASRIWQGVAKGLTADAISEEISRECDVARDLVQQHTSKFLTELERRGLVTPRMAAGS